MRTPKVVAAALALGLGVGVSLIGALPAAAQSLVSLDDPGPILTTDTALNFSGTTETTISTITITFADESSGVCTVSAADPPSWACNYDVPSTLAEGQGQLYFEFVDPNSAPETATFTVAAPEAPLPDPAIGLNDPGAIYDIDTDLAFTGTTNREISGVSITFADASTGECVVSTGDDPSLWSCDYSNLDGLPVGAATLDFSFVGGGTAQEGFTVLPALVFDAPGAIYSSDSSIGFSGTVAAEISAATITFFNADTANCEVSYDLENTSLWSCATTVEDGFPWGPGHLDVTVSGKVYTLQFTVFDYSVPPYLEAPLFDYGQISATGGLTGAASAGTTQLYSWNSDSGPVASAGSGNTPGSCDLAITPAACTIAVGPGLWEVRATQNWGDAETDPTTTSYNFRIPAAPVAYADPQANGVVAFWGYSDGTNDHITVKDAGGDVICTATTVDQGDGGNQWSCESAGQLDPSMRDFFVSARDDQHFDGSSSANENFAEAFAPDSTYLSGGLSALTEISIPNVSYHFTPGGLVVTGTPTDPATVVGTQLTPDPYSSPEADTPGGCPTLTDGGGAFDGVASGTSVCTFTELQPGPWQVSSYQDSGDGQTRTGSSVDRQFFIPEAPIIAVVSGNSLNAVTISGDLGDAPPYYYSDYRGIGGDVVHVYNGTATLCTALVHDDLSWHCTTAPLPGGTYGIRAAVEDRTYGSDGWWPRYLGGGLSSLSTPNFGITLPPLATSGPSTPPNPDPTPGPTPTPTPTSPAWSFDLKGLDLNNVHPGDTFTITGSGLPAGSVITIELHSAPIILGTVTVSPGGTFTLNGTIPSNVEPGAHHIVATLTAPGSAPSVAEKAITVTGEATTASGSESSSGTTSAGGSSAHGTDVAHELVAPNILTDSLNPIAQIFADPGRVPAAFAAGLVLLLFAIMPAHLLNATIGEQYERLARRVPRLRTQPRWYVAARSMLTRAPVLGGLLLTAVSAFLFGFADPSFGLNLHSLRLVIALAAALFIVTYLANAITGAILRRAWNVDVVVSIRPLGLVLTVIGVVLSRILDFSPGFLIGLAIGLSIATHAAAKQAWKAVLIRTSLIVAFGVIAWIVYSSIAPGVHHDPTFWGELVLELFVAIVTEGVVMLLIELLPFHLLEGERLYRRSKLLWAVAYIALLVVFILAVVPWEGNWRALGDSFWPWFTAVAIFGAICVGIYLYFRFLAPEHHDEEELHGPPEVAEEDDRVAVGDDL